MSCQGVVKSFNDGKGWGFIVYEGSDVFVHIKDCQGGKPNAGDAVSFDLDQEKASAGQMKATNVVGGTGSLEDAFKGKGKGNGTVVTGPGSCQGTVKSFSEAKGWGFIDYSGTDVFCHIKDCVGGQPQTGDYVSFDVEESPMKPGSMRAKNVAGGTGWPAGCWGGGGWGKGGCKGGYGPAWGGGGGCWGGGMGGPYGGGCKGWGGGKGKADGWGTW